MTSWQEQMAYDIRIVWDNDEDTHRTIQMLIDEADHVVDLAHALNDFYEDSIDFILRETPHRWIGNALVGQICTNVGMSVFDQIAHGYWRDRKNIDTTS